MKKRAQSLAQLIKCPECGAQLVPSGKQVRALREAAGLTQRQFADALGVKASHVAYLENERRHPSGALILRYRALKHKLEKQIADSARATLKKVGEESKRARSKVKQAA